MNLTPQEIRRCMFDSKFYDLLYKTNTEKRWRDLVGAQIPDIHMKDVEILLRGIRNAYAGGHIPAFDGQVLERFL